MTSVEYGKTSEGYLAARCAHLTFAMIPTAGSADRIMIRWPNRDPSELTAREFSMCQGLAANETAFRNHVEEFAAEIARKAALGRVNCEKPSSTPWGRADNATQFAPGIISVSTGSHGGFLLSEERNAQIDPRWRNHAGEYEEDCSWAIVAYTYPEFFTPTENECAQKTLRCDYPQFFQDIANSDIENTAIQKAA